ncbi:acyl carrier protein [Collinsella intestinalis]|uniref:acyl carrier protein n=1 Tax=Collinsella intestinalis TaxID=147207 RepID=UPI00195CFCFE|nr:acyl carrier protein [Collinsella intestinalis]MBM6908590.1 acyl carrier protein [Collinsella intestinalis]
MDTIIDILEELKPGIDFETEQGLVRRRVLDSLTIIALISELEDEFDITIPAVEIVADNFDSAESIYTLIERLLDEDL